MKGLILAPRADADYRRILLRSETRWGEDRRDQIVDDFDRVFTMLRVNSEMGVAREELSRGLRSFYEQPHFIYYRIRSDQIRIVRILHERQLFRS